MTSNNIRGSTSRDSAEWKTAWGAVSRLAAARQDAWREAGQDAGEGSGTANGAVAAPSLTGSFREQVAIDPDEYARAIAEIEQAAAALRRAEPALEAWRPEPAATGEPRNSRSVWILVSGIWLSTVTVFAGAIGAILYLLG